MTNTIVNLSTEQLAWLKGANHIGVKVELYFPDEEVSPLVIDQTQEDVLSEVYGFVANLLVGKHETFMLEQRNAQKQIEDMQAKIAYLQKYYLSDVTVVEL